MWRGVGVGGSAPSEMEFWKQADAAQALHKDLVRKYRLRQVLVGSPILYFFLCFCLVWVQFECFGVSREFFFGDLGPETWLMERCRAVVTKPLRFGQPMVAWRNYWKRWSNATWNSAKQMTLKMSPWGKGPTSSVCDKKGGGMRQVRFEVECF